MNMLTSMRLRASERLITNFYRQLVTNHFLHFLALERADPKKFQVLQIIAALLGWTDGTSLLSQYTHFTLLTSSQNNANKPVSPDPAPLIQTSEPRSRSGTVLPARLPYQQSSFPTTKAERSR